MGVSESHLTNLGIRKFKQELQCIDKSYDFVPSAPVPYRSRALTSIAGTYQGAGFISNLPSRKLQPSWTHEEWEGARFTMGAFHLGQSWVHGAVFYGQSYRAETPEVAEKTDQLLAIATKRIVYETKGYRFICGDFNQEYDAIHQPRSWESLGWREVQRLHLAINGVPVKPTCKRVTTKDFIYVSPELAKLFQSVDVLNHVYPDHGVLLANFKLPHKPESVQLWRKPNNLDHQELEHIDSEHWVPPEGSTMQQIVDISQEFERRVDVSQRKRVGMGIQPSQKGRSQTLAPTCVPAHNAPLKPSRHGDFQPAFHRQHLTYQRWVTQLRRCESLLRLLQKTLPWTLNQRIHAHAEWRTICKSNCATPSFAHWWESFPDKLGTPFIPDSHHLPSAAELHSITITVTQFVRQMEKVLMRDARKIAVRNREQDPQKIFRDFSKPAVNPVKLLDHSVTAKVLEHDDTEHAILVDLPKRDFEPGTLQTTVGPIEVIHYSEGKLWLENAEQLPPPQSTIRQEKLIGSVKIMREMFVEEWTKRWDRHKNVPASHWAPLTDFFRAAFPPSPVMPNQPITLHVWKRALRKKRKHAASGPDGWSRKELLSLPDDLTLSVLSILEKIEGGAPWPPQMTLGLVHSLEKLDNAALVTDFRPITIFSLIYRTWSSIRARQCLLHLSSVAPPRCFGNLPTKSATQLWMGIQVSIEDASDITQCTGVVIDIVKCFNHLPRLPILEICVHLGLASGIIRAWTTALSSLERRFAIRGSVSDPVKSTTGLAEGCGLSVVGMLVTNILIDTWLRLREPNVHLWSFVDNLELTSPDINATIRGLEHLLSITSLLDLKVDTGKSHGWANNTPDRTQLRSHGLDVKMFSRDLGGHMQYSGMSTNSVITNKIAEFRPRWKQLARSAASYKQKLHAICAAAWPSILHGIGSVHLGDAHYDDLRTLALRSLGESRTGTSPMLHLSLVEHPNHDPAFYALWVTASNIRTMVSYDVAQPILTRLAVPNLRQRPPPGPCSVLLHRLNQVAWSWQDTHFCDHNGMRIDLWQCCIQELKVRLVEAWQVRISHLVSNRKTFQGMETTSARLTMEKHPDHNKYRAPDETTKCAHCQEQDSITHRLWECQAFTSLRNISDECKQWAANKPATLNHGWIPLPSSVLHHREMLLAPCEALLAPNHPGFEADLLDFFTDGACRDPTDKICRIASWAPVVSNPDNPYDFPLVSASHLTGFIQTSSRAELTAAIAACIAAQAWNKPFRIWTDSQHVANTIQAIIAGTLVPDQERKTNHDLVNELRTYLGQVSHLFQGCVKVVSHQNPDSASEPENWAFRGNEAADTEAARFLNANTAIMQTWKKMKLEVDTLRKYRDELRGMYLKISQACLLARSSRANANSGEGPSEEVRYKQTELESWLLPRELPPELAEYNIPTWNQIASWVHSLHNPQGEIFRWSWFQLVIDFHNQLRCNIPWYHLKRQQWHAYEIHRADLSKEAKNLGSFLLAVGRNLEQPLPLKTAHPHSAIMCFRTKTLTVSIERSRQNEVEVFLASINSPIRGASGFKGVFC